MKKIVLSSIFAFLLIFMANAQTGNDTDAVNDSINPNEEAVVSLSEEDLDSDGEGENSVSGILHGSRDAFLSAAAYTFGPLRFRIRGYDSEFSSVYLNGIPTNDMESGRASWFLWSGLNDVVRNKSTTLGIASTDYSFGNLGGVTAILAKPSQQRTGTKIVYSSSNRSYTNRTMATHSTGMMENGWAFTASLSKRWSIENTGNTKFGDMLDGYVDGTFYDSYGYFAAAEKKINAHHSVALTVFGTPSKRGKPGASTQEVYDLTGNNYYNPNWGWQDGRRRNARIRETHKPMGILNYDWTINEGSSLSFSGSYTQGKNTNTALNWYNAVDPRPDYYRYLPSYFTENPAAAAQRAEEFRNGERQLNWDAMYETNRNNMSTEENVTIDGVAGKTKTGLLSEYIIENRNIDEKQYTGNLLYSKEFSENISLTSGLEYRKYIGSHYTTIRDLLGGEFIVDRNKYAERDFPGNEDAAQNDIDNPNRIVTVGDRFGSDYDANIQTANLWAQGNFSYTKVDFFVAGKLMNTNFWRKGNMRNGLYPNNSFGDSEHQKFTDYAVKAGATYKINGRNYITANILRMTKAPNFRSAFISARTRNSVINNLKSQTIQSANIGYVLRTPIIKATFNAYYTTFTDQVWVRSFYHDAYRNFVNYSMSGINKTHQGTELGIEAKLTSTLTLNVAGAAGFYKWTSRPVVDITVDNDSEPLVENETVYAKGFLVSGTPQTAASVGLNYRSPNYWFLGINANYADDIYLSFNPARRMAATVDGIPQGSEKYNAFINQEQMPAITTLDLSIGKSLRWVHKYSLSINLNVSNVLNNKTFITGGYEQLRIDNESDPSLRDPSKFDPKYYYLYGRTYFLNLSFRF